MRKYHAFALAAVAALFALSCSEEPVDVQTETEETGEITYLEAGFEGADETRTLRQADGKVFWSPGDEIAIIRGTTSAGKKKFMATNTEPAARAVFSGTMPAGSASYWAVYPYTDDVYNNGTYIVTTLPSEQEAVAGTFADDLFISAAYVRNSATSITFVHQCGGVKFSVTEPGVQKVRLIPAKEDVYLAGLIGLYAASTSASPYIRATGYPEDMSSTVELSAPEGETLQVGEAYHFVTIPATLTGGFSLVFQKEDGSVAIRRVEKDVQIKAGHFATLMEADKGLEYGQFFRYSPESVSIEAEGGLFAVDIEGTYSYHIDSYSDWITAVSTSGDPLTGCRHTYYVEPNTSGEERTGMLSVCYGDNCYPLLVTQSAAGGTKVIPHHSLGMRFTATWCGYCPMMDEAFHKVKESMGDKFEYICLYSSSNGGNYGTTAADVLNNQYQISGFPTGIIDGRFELINYQDTGYTAQVGIDAMDETEKYYPATSSIALSSTVSGQVVTVKADVYTAREEEYKITAFLVENDIVGYQADYTNGSTNTFNHSRVARILLNSNAMGDSFEADADATRTFTYTATVPEDYNLENMAVLVYVQRSYGDRPAVQSGSYGDFYVDNCRYAALGATADPEVN